MPERKDLKLALEAEPDDTESRAGVTATGGGGGGPGGGGVASSRRPAGVSGVTGRRVEPALVVGLALNLRSPAFKLANCLLWPLVPAAVLLVSPVCGDFCPGDEFGETAVGLELRAVLCW